ncbi:efflux transporter outer membrane subunit [Bordetella pseudohinzii]|uniref:Outer membrane protein oprM n=1 Tax=Bordetella pseudohinzii TaxID=1331258 RepID=A0A0J6C5H0_9BORD|nr:efflux transporter outer membrane subunit [Bordetella pseudohinzii]ANY16095.1 RND transporter [Bordetella pseudohinzii]KMM24507.1 RND transporter [Bordetella pseudohinzii]KXA78528.1 RND transporter [Bordetella pseudohinzii]KXA78596.1 RND transporter [Bordetella pseudohinzii]CUJ10729.1 Outer membrane protein oprM precursor [Bordetella pseudohinzii]
MTRRLLSLAISASLLSGCMSLAPEHTRPPLPVAATFPQPGAPVSETVPAAAVDWQSFYTDPELRGLIARALINNRDLRMAVLRVEEARAAYGIQRADQFPTLGVGADFLRQRSPGDLSFTGEPLTASQYQVGVGLASWELDFWGRVRNLKDAALENYLATDAARQAATLSLIAQVADSYLTLRELDERLALTRATIASREESLRIFRRRYEVGAISKLDLTQVETLWQQAKALGAELERTRAAQAQALQELVGQPISLPEARTALDDDALMRELPAGLPSDLLTNRPDIVAAEHQLKANNANIGAARAAFLPQITLTGAFGTASSQLGGLFEGGSLAWNFAPSLNLPIFDAGRRQANLELAQARQQQAVAQYEKSIQTAFREVADALSARYWLAEQVKVLHATVDAQAERERLARLRYDHGASPFLEVLDAQRDLLEAQQQWVRTRRALLSSQVALYAALGGGTHAQPVEAAEPATTEHP